MLGIYLFVTHLLILLEGALLIAGSIGAFMGGTEMIASGILMVALWGVFIALTILSIQKTYAIMGSDGGDPADALAWGDGLFLAGGYLSALSGLGLGFLAFASCGPLFVSPYFHWIGLAGTIILFLAYHLLPLVCSASIGDPHPVNHFTWSFLYLALPVALLWGIVWIVLYAKLHGSIDLTQYHTAQKSSPYKLPFPSGEDSWVIQGNNSSWDHQGSQGFAYDFRRRCGTPVLAARAGTVIKVVDSNDGHGSNSPNNMIWVLHSDSTVAQYLHIMKGSAKVKAVTPGKPPQPGETVKQGDVLALVGNVGLSLTGHIHFEVDTTSGGSSMGVTFSDVSQDSGIPRTFSTYVSANPK